MVPDAKFVETNPNYAFSEIQFVIEGFANNDIGMLLQITSAEGLPLTDFIIHRTGIDEVNYSKLAPGELASLVQNGYHPRMEDLENRSYVCSSFSKTARSIDFKTRAYYNTNGACNRFRIWTVTWSLGFPRKKVGVCQRRITTVAVTT